MRIHQYGSPEVLMLPHEPGGREIRAGYLIRTAYIVKPNGSNRFVLAVPVQVCASVR